MRKPTNLVTLKNKLAKTRDRIAAERQKIIKADPLPSDFNRSGYLFTYRRAEQLGLSAIRARMDEIHDWLPIQLEIGDEVAPETKHQMRDWLLDETAPQPSAEDFGNDFVHALTRQAVRHGIDSPEFEKLADRIGCLFRDITCVISVIHCCMTLIAMDIKLAVLGDTSDLPKLARNLAVLTEEKEAAAEKAQQTRLRRKPALPSKKKPKLKLVKSDKGDE